MISASVRICHAARGAATTRHRVLLAALWLLIFSRGVEAQGPAFLVKDIETTPVSSVAYGLLNVDGTLFFFHEGGSGTFLWRSDGTEAGTLPIRALPARLETFPFTYPRGLTDLDGTLFFFAPGALWRSDGSESGTGPVLDGSGHDGGELINIGGTLFFTVVDTTADPDDYQLWSSNGTTFNPLLANFYRISGLENLDGILVFVADDGLSGKELWRSDGTEVGTRRVKDINPQGNGLRDGTQLLNVNGVVFFFADDGSGSRDLWRSDGTDAGTVKVKDFDRVNDPTLGHSNGLLFFCLDGALWRSDGTGTGTVRVAGFGLGNQVAASYVDVHGTLFAFVSHPSGSYGLSLWKSDGTAEGTVRLWEFPFSSSFVAGAADSEGTFLFQVLDVLPTSRYPIVSPQLWRTDGTAEGTTKLRQFGPEGALALGFGGLLVADNVWFFTSEGELWRSDGTEGGTLKVKDLGGPDTLGSSPRNLTDADGVLFFRAQTCGGEDRICEESLWRSDGTENGTIPLPPADGDSYFPDLAPLINTGSSAFFYAVNRASRTGQLWRSDGSPADTVVVKEFPLHTHLEGLTAVGRTLFFSLHDLSGTETPFSLWRSDGTAAGTKPVKPGVGGYGLTESLIDVGGTLFFGSGAGLWKSDGTEAGTVLVKDMYSLYHFDFVGLGKNVLFVADDGSTGYELWRSDGTDAGTVRVKDIVPGPRTPFIDTVIDVDGHTSISIDPELTVVNDTLFFVAVNETHGRELWRSDGTEEGTRSIARFTLDLFFLTNVNGTLFFVTNGGTDLWKSDGSEGGTEQIASFPGGLEGLADVNGTLVFSSDGRLWRSDGTAGGTTQIDGVPSTTRINGPVQRSGSRLFFSAAESLTGSELWALPLAQLSCGNAISEPGEACDAGGESETCDTDCTPAECGDGILNATAGEECDVGDPLDGACCTDTCTTKPAGTTCSTANVCDGTETCDQGGRCLPGRLLDCDDGNLNTIDTCEATLGCLHPASCGGDCNVDGMVSIDELVTTVSITLGSAPRTACHAGDANGNGDLTIDELLIAVKHALGQCPSEPVAPVSFSQ